MFIFSPQSIGPIWPAMLVFFLYMAATTLFLVLARFRAWLSAVTLREQRFLQRIYDATEMFSTLAILSGMIGTCLGLLDALPVLGATLQNAGDQHTIGQVLVPLRHVWVSTIAGLALGGLWGEVLLFFLKPHVRPPAMPTSRDEPPPPPAVPPVLAPTPGGLDDEPDSDDDADLEDDWRQYNSQGMY